jgi:hypothetical protein
MDKSPAEIYLEKAKRIDDALNLRIPDRIPMEIAFGYFPAIFGGITCDAAYYDYDAWLAACQKTVAAFPDVDVPSVQYFFPGEVLELMDPKTLAWPGGGAPVNHGHQSLEDEFMKGHEYPDFLNDQTDFLLRHYLPRAIGAMQAFEKWPSYAGPSYGYHSALALAGALCEPDIQAAIERLQKAGKVMKKWQPKLDRFVQSIRDMGNPPFFSSFAIAPFDVLSDHMRGMRGSMLDMLRRPDAVEEAVHTILERQKRAMQPAVPGLPNTVSIPLHRGSDGFMSIKQFERFYWPGLKGLILALIDKGLQPLVFFEGDYTNRLEYLLELPKGSIYAHMDMSDIFRAKEVLNGHLCISGNVPCSLIQTGTVDQVKEHCKKMIDVCGKDGGFIMSTRSPVDDAKPELLKAMIEFTAEYGVYR